MRALAVTILLIAQTGVFTALHGEEQPFELVRKYDFDDGNHRGADPTDAGTIELTDDTYDGAGKAVRTVNDKTYIGMSWYQRDPIVEKGTTLVFAYKAVGVKGSIFVQCNEVQVGNLHAEVKPTVHGEWAIARIDLGRQTDWGGKYKDSKGRQFRGVQIYGDTKGSKGVLTIDNVVVFNGQDRKPPSAPQGLAAQIADYKVRLSWQRAEDETFVAEYKVYRGIAPDFAPSQENLIGRTPKLTIDDDTITNFGVFYYKVRATDALGNEGEASRAFRLVVADEN